MDTLARHAVGVEENSAKEMGVWIANVEALAREFGCTVLLVHHIGKVGPEWDARQLGATGRYINSDCL